MEPADVLRVLAQELGEIDDDTREYFCGMIMESGSGGVDEEALQETLVPFLESYGLADTEKDADALCKKVCEALRQVGMQSATKTTKQQEDKMQLLDKGSRLGDNLLSQEEQDTLDSTMWGFDSIRAKKNQEIPVDEEGNYVDFESNIKMERKAIKEQKKFLQEMEKETAKFFGDDDNDPTRISTMTLPDLSGKNREKDIQVSNFTITYGGHVLLDGADLRLAHGRRYGLVGRNGIGKTTLLKHMATFDIEGFPKHHRVLHVKQEVSSSAKSVLQVVVESDVERSDLLNKEQALLAKQKSVADSETSSTEDMEELVQALNAVYDRMEQIGVASAESRAAEILYGLRFTEEMQASSTDSLSGGWRMRVALAGALFIQPDLLMLDEPTNHLDLEAVLWLENYLQSYPHTILLVSHDRAFLNEVCNDIIRFADKKLTYYRGNYDIYEGTYKEHLLRQQREHEAQKAKIAHMQEFVDKFRFNANRAALVQSRIKAIERETVVEAVVEEAEFSFSFIDAGQLGRPIVQIEGVTFGFKDKPLFKDVHLNLDQQSRVALVGPNGAGKSTLLNLIQDKHTPWEGVVRVNPSLRIGIFTQHHLDSFDLTLSALDNMKKKWPLVHEQELRSHLGRYEIQGNDALKPLKFVSGGQKSRVAFAVLTWSKPHIVILDEPTNHLDMGAINALADALKKFTGGVLIISHDQHFITSVCSEIWQVKDQSIKTFDGDFQAYKVKAVKELAKATAALAKNRGKSSN